MKIFLVNPACLDERITDDDAMSVPMGIYYLGALILENGFDIKIVNLASNQNFSPSSPDSVSIGLKQSKNNSQNISSVEYLMQLVESDKPDVIGFSVLNANRHCAMEAATAVKKLNPHIHTVFGGPAPTFEPYYFFKSCPALDYIVKGEGEDTFLELISCLENNSRNIGENKSIIRDIKGLVLREYSPADAKNFIIENAQRSLISNLDHLPHPAKYFGFQHISLSRGCPGRCTFCGSPDFWGKGKVRFHSAKWFVDEIELLVNRGILHFFVSDDTFTMKKKLVIDVCQKIISRFIDYGINITWAAISRVDFIDEQILFYMRKAGCIQISYGVESGSDKIRKTLGKTFKNETIIKAFRLTASFGILPRAYFIYGSPGESDKTINQSIELIEHMRPLGMVSYMLVLFPGTSLYRYFASNFNHETGNAVSSNSNKETDCKTTGNEIAKPDSNPLDALWSQKIEDIPWFEIDPNLDFEQVRGFGERLRNEFYSKVHSFALDVNLVDNAELYTCHADFLSRLAMTFSHGDYALNPKVKNQLNTAKALYQRALLYAPDSRAYLGLAMLLQKQKDFTGAIDVIKQAFGKLNPSDSDMCDQNVEVEDMPDISVKAKNMVHRAIMVGDIAVRRQLTLCMAVSMMNLGQFKNALASLEPFGHDDEIKPYIHACQSRL